MEINCLIIDDEPAATRVVESYLKKLPSFKLVEKCKSAFEAIKVLQSTKIDVMFLDINMPGLSGLDFLKSLRNPPVVIIITAYREYALESYELEVIDYLHKPFSFDRFFKATQRVEDKFIHSVKTQTQEITSSKKEFLFIKSDKKHFKIVLDDLLYIESMGDYCKFITSDKTFTSYITLKKILESLPNSFVRCHKSFIVQFNKIKVVEGNTIKISTHKIPIGSSYKKSILNLLEN